MFVNNSNGRIGLVGYWDCICFDEFAGKDKRVDKTLVDIMKNYMANKTFSRGIEQLAASCVQGRGVLVDLRGAGEGPLAAVGYDALMRAMAAQGAEAGEGDFLCIYTGYADILLRDGAEASEAELGACPGLDGKDRALLDWIDRSGIAAICAAR